MIQKHYPFFQNLERNDLKGHLMVNNLITERKKKFL